MIRITVELCKYGDTSNPEHLGTMKIWNDLTGDHTTGNYRFSISKKGLPNQIWKTGEVKGFKRLRRNAWDLLYLCLVKAVAGRN